MNNRNVSIEYIRKALSCEYVGSDTEADYQPQPEIFSGPVYSRPSSAEAEEMILKNESSALKRKLIRFCFSHKEFIKNIPFFGKKLVSVKENKLNTSRKCVDISPYLPLHYSEFIPQMYKLLLNRQPDGEGLNSFIGMVKRGASNAAVAYVFSVSEEFAGRFSIAGIKNYRKQYKKYIRKVKLRRIPVIGRIAQVFAIPSQISAFKDDYEYYNGQVMQHIAAVNQRLVMTEAVLNNKISTVEAMLGRDIDTVKTVLTGDIDTVKTVLTGDIDTVRTVLAGDIDTVRTELTGDIDTVKAVLIGELDAAKAVIGRETGAAKEELERGMRALSAAQAECYEKMTAVEGAAAGLKTKIYDMQDELADLKNSDAVLRKKFASLESIPERKAENMDYARELEYIKSKLNISYDPELIDDDIIDYFDFEDHFRGSREEIKNRQRQYMPYFQTGHTEGAVLELGFGRGELLELLKETGIRAKGVDCYPPFVEYCRNLGLNVSEGDALTYLTECRDESLNGIILSQVAEHINSDYLYQLIRTGYSKLKSGCCFLIETPNPETLSTYINFYIDGSHVKPVHYLTLEYFFKANKYSEIIRLADEYSISPYGDNFTREFIDKCGDEAKKNVLMELNKIMFSGRDYTIIARK